jgi:hypothetical protein
VAFWNIWINGNRVEARDFVLMVEDSVVISSKRVSGQGDVILVCEMNQGRLRLKL